MPRRRFEDRHASERSRQRLNPDRIVGAFLRLARMCLPPATVPRVRTAPHRQGQPVDPTTKEGTGTMRIGLTSIFVDDQDQAERFYTQVLGLREDSSHVFASHPS
jgi:hypothetical protein